MERRSSTFQLLKPPCVRLSEAALNFRLSKIGGKELTSSVDNLLITLQHISRSSCSLDAKLADYVFFPLSQILQERRNAPVRTLEIALQCLDLLLQGAWRNDMNVDLSIQLFILLTHLASSDDDSIGKFTTSDELRTIAFLCQTHLLNCADSTPAMHDAFLKAEFVPALGHSITVMLEGSKTVMSKDMHLAALGTLKTFMTCFDDREMLASFFPGVVSSLTQILTPTTNIRRHFRVLEMALILLTYVIRRLLSDTELFRQPSNPADTQKILTLKNKDAAWLSATSAQVKLALANVARLRDHNRSEVLNALFELCWTVLQECQSSLSESAPMMLQVLVSLAERSQKSRELLAHIVNVDRNMSNMLRENTYDWLVSLSRIMLSNDETLKKKSITRISSAYSILTDADVDMSMIDGIMLSTVADSLTNAICVSSRSGLLASDISESVHSNAITSEDQGRSLTIFAAVLGRDQKGVDTITSLQNLLQQVASSNRGLKMARDSLEAARASEGEARLVNLWLSLVILRPRAFNADNASFDTFIENEPVTNLETQPFEDLYSFAVALLNDAHEADVIDWRHQALALEVFALQALRLKEDFRLELVDALYPMIHLMASRNRPLREHAMTCLNITARSCGYIDTQDLLVSNVDYVINAIGAKLSMFDLSPEAPQVLLMMIKLCGSILLPYLDDLIESIFDALECFHRYPSLVEMLFTVLKGVVEEGVKAPKFLITMEDRVSHLKPALAPTSIALVTSSLRARREGADKTADIGNVAAEIEENDRKANLRTSGRDHDVEELDEALDEDTPTDPKSITSHAAPPLSKTYQMLEKITSLTQYHLPSSSPSIRFSLISLLVTVLPYLSQHEDTFLPMVHTLWPVLIPRLDDKEAYVVAGILDVLGSICDGAGDFVSSRIEGLWPTIRRIWRTTLSSLAEHNPQKSLPQPVATRQRLESTTPTEQHTESLVLAPAQVKLSITEVSNVVGQSQELDAMILTGSSDDSKEAFEDHHYTPTTTLTVRAALIRFLMHLLQHVRVSEEIFAEILSEMLYDALVNEGRIDVKEALEARSPDAVWLVLERAKWAGRRVEGERLWSRKIADSRAGLHAGWSLREIVL